MSKYEEQIENQGYKCPYCKEMHICDDWGYDYDGMAMECEECGRKFTATANHSVDFFATADCELNNEKHDLEFHSITTGHSGARYNSYFCKTCGECILKEI